MYTPIKLDKTRNVLLGFEALRLFKSLTGKSLLKMDYENDDIEDYIPKIIYVGLIHEDKEITEDQVIELIDKHLGLHGAMELFNKVFEEQIQPKKIPEENEGKN